MKVNRPIVSLVVPTKNRYFYLKKLIQVVDGFGNKDFIELTEKIILMTTQNLLTF